MRLWIVFAGLTLGASPVCASKYRIFWLSFPSTFHEPVKTNAEVEFVSDGYRIKDGACRVTRSSGDASADLQACKTVNFRRASKPIRAEAVVWISKPLPTGYVPPVGLNTSSPVMYSDYPSESLKKKEQGTVVVRVEVQSDGKAKSCSVASTSGFARLDRAATETLCARLKLKPAMLDGKAIASVNFTQVSFYTGE